MPTNPVPSKPSVPGSGTAAPGMVVANPVLLVQEVRSAAEQTCNSKAVKLAALRPVPEIVKVKVLMAVLPAPVML